MPNTAQAKETNDAFVSSALDANSGVPPEAPGHKILTYLVVAGAFLAVVGSICYFLYKDKLSAPQDGELSEQEKQQVIEEAAANLVTIDFESSSQALPVVDESKAVILDSFFKLASSANYKSEYLKLVPDAGAESYLEYERANGAAKVEAARAFYIYLRNPSAPLSDSGYATFLSDVKLHLESVVGQTL